MRDIKEVRDKIYRSYRDAKHFYSDAYPPSFVGRARSRFIKTIGGTEVLWNSDTLRMKFYSASFGEKRLGPGEIEVEGDMLVTALFGDENKETYFFSRSGLLRAIGHGYSHIVKSEVTTVRGSTIVESEREDWPHLLEFYLRRGNFDIPEEGFLGLMGRRRTRLPSDGIEKAHYEEMTSAAQLLKEVFDKSKNYKCVVPLGSIKPFSKAIPKRVQVHGDNMRILYIPSDSGTPQREKLSGSIYLFTTDVQTIPTPLLIHAGFGETGYAEFPIRGAEMIRTDGQRKLGRLELVSKGLELYVRQVKEAEFGRDAKDILQSLISTPLTYVSVGMILGLPLFARVVRVRPALVTLALAGLLSGVYTLYSSVSNAPKKVIGDDYIYFLARGKELT